MNTYAKDYESIKSYIQAGRDKTIRKIANNTTARIEGNKVIIKYHNTDIVELQPDGVILHDGGYKTFTTKERLNWYLPKNFVINQANFNWILRNYVTQEEWQYQDGITIFYDGIVTNAGAKSESKRIAKINERINKYVTAYVDKLISGKMRAPGNGDCWACLFVDQETGKEVLGNDHLLLHMQERYYVPSLLWNAIKEFPVSIIVHDMIIMLWNKDERANNDQLKDITREQATSSLKRYMKRHLNLA